MRHGYQPTYAIPPEARTPPGTPLKTHANPGCKVEVIVPPGRRPDKERELLEREALCLLVRLSVLKDIQTETLVHRSYGETAYEVENEIRGINATLQALGTAMRPYYLREKMCSCRECRAEYEWSETNLSHPHTDACRLYLLQRLLVAEKKRHPGGVCFVDDGVFLHAMGWYSPPVARVTQDMMGDVGVSSVEEWNTRAAENREQMLKDLSRSGMYPLAEEIAQGEEMEKAREALRQGLEKTQETSEPEGPTWKEGGTEWKVVTEGHWTGWVCKRHPDGHWVTYRKLSPDEMATVLLFRQLTPTPS